MHKSLFAVVIGGSIGCMIRWILPIRLNALFPNLPPGTLVISLVGEFIIGMTPAFFVRQSHLDPVWKFFITTGLCGDVAIFSAFSVKMVALLQNGNYAWAVVSVLTHVTGSFLMTATGFFVTTLL